MPTRAPAWPPQPPPKSRQNHCQKGSAQADPRPAWNHPCWPTRHRPAAKEHPPRLDTQWSPAAVSYTHLRAHETSAHL
eukprot:13764250-Alexandrium_andersonii.AAC.1